MKKEGEKRGKEKGSKKKGSKKIEEKGSRRLDKEFRLLHTLKTC